jgi:predicted MarR family transcription regulator
VKVSLQNDVQVDLDMIPVSLNSQYDLILGKPFLKEYKATQNLGLDSVEYVVGGTKYKLLQKPKEKKEESVEISLLELEELQRSGEIEEIFLVQVTAKETEEEDVGIEKEMMKLLREFPDILPDSPQNAKLTKLENHGYHKIEVPKDAKPVKQHPYRLSPNQTKVLQDELKKLTDKGMIKSSASPWASPVLFVAKKDGTLRMVVDYRGLNKLTKVDATPIPRIEDNLAILGTSRYFSVIDLQSGFNQIPMHPDSREYTAFNTRYGQYEYHVMPFGLRNAPSTFQRVMNNVLSDLIDKVCVCYIDDILIFGGDTKDSHLKNLKLVLQRLQDFGLKN